MPRFPDTSPSVSSVRGSVFHALGAKMSGYRGPTYPLHIGDTWMEPAEGCRMEDVRVGDHPGLHRYAPVQGIPSLIDAVARRVTVRTGRETDPAEVLITAGATGGLGAAIGALVAPGDEVLILAPHWPLVAGIVRSFHAVPVAVPFIGAVDSPESAVGAVRRALTGKTVALYVNTPNNPTGRLIPRAWLEALVAFAREQGLWVFSDEVYEDYVYEGEHTYVRTLAPERTLSVYSCSKAFGMAGNRCGWLVGPAEVLADVRKVSTHTFYSTPTAAQIVAARALTGGADAWVAEARRQYRALGAYAADRLGVAPPEGSTFLFLDVSAHLDARGLEGFLGDCLDRGLFLAPGTHFGPYPSHVRVCFTSAEPDVVRRGVDLLAERMGR